ncbi:hypothetical protein C2G38_2175180 [Gigaspora rosea]|uniref:Uncharacterized protein n=1 Tax=Gigaspora rosea TaxID=44941 RepID=A0A397VS71_9GLOM|nr:hypothetical protein C2G38_2175180 [Gigaspora rosea]
MFWHIKKQRVKYIFVIKYAMFVVTSCKTALHSANIADLVLSSQHLKSKDDTVYGNLPYIAPDFLNGKTIYHNTRDLFFGKNHVGNLMWDRVTYIHKSGEINLLSQIFSGLWHPLTRSTAVYDKMLRRTT